MLAIGLHEAGHKVVQVGDSSFLAVAVVALEAAPPVIPIARFKVNRTGLVLVGMLMDPRADNAVTALLATEGLEV